jgi:hypothetical protein
MASTHDIPLDQYDEYYTGLDEELADPTADTLRRRRRLRFGAALGLCVLLAAGTSAVTGMVVSSLNRPAVAPPSAAAQIASAHAAGFTAGRTLGFRQGVRAGFRAGTGRGRLTGFGRGFRSGRAEGFRLGQLAGFRQGYSQAVSDTTNQYQAGIQTLSTQLTQTKHQLAQATHALKKPHH